MPHPTSSCPGPMSRRGFLRACSLSLGGLGLANLLPLRARAREAGRTVPDTSVIFLWLPGGPPHMETYDMKPDAPAEYRGDFRPIRTNVPGIDVCEHLPLHAKRRRQVHPHPLDRPQLRRPRRRAQAVPHRPRPDVAGRLRQRLPDGRLDGRQGARGPQRRACRTTSPAPTAAAHGIDVFSFGSAYLGAVDAPVHRRRRPERRRSSRSRTWRLAPALADRLPRPRRAAGAARPAPRRDVDRTGTMEAMDAVRAAGAGAADDRRGPRGVRPVAGAGASSASATACTPGASGRCWPGGWSRRGPAS